MAQTVTDILVRRSTRSHILDAGKGEYGIEEGIERVNVLPPLDTNPDNPPVLGQVYTLRFRLGGILIEIGGMVFIGQSDITGIFRFAKELLSSSMS